ncbi:MAG TPA: Snf7 family protein [Candidatus Bathyarchaeia archaeon]|nr:Snf7 family protein [Candidatus Bathyarchaeia archaeon]
MSEHFAKKWESRRNEASFTDTLREVVKPQPPLKPRMDFAVRRLELQVSKLDQANERFTQKDKALFAKLVDAYAKHDTARANIYATELAEVRKMAKLVMNAGLALDQVILRIRTCTEFGDIVANLGPAIGVLRSVGSCMGGVLPEAENELGEIGNMLSGLMFDAGLNSGMTMNFDSVNEDAAKILNEAATVAEQKVSANFPDLPMNLATNVPGVKTPTQQS